MADPFAPGALIFTDDRAGIVLGYVDREEGDGPIERKVIVARFASSEEAPPAALAGSPVRPHDDGPEHGSVPAEPTHGDGGSSAPATTGSDPASVSVAADHPSEGRVQTAQTTVEAQEAALSSGPQPGPQPGTAKA